MLKPLWVWGEKTSFHKHVFLGSYPSQKQHARSSSTPSFSGQSLLPIPAYSSQPRSAPLQPRSVFQYRSLCFTVQDPKQHCSVGSSGPVLFCSPHTACPHYSTGRRRLVHFITFAFYWPKMCFCLSSRSEERLTALVLSLTYLIILFCVVIGLFQLVGETP